MTDGPTATLRDLAAHLGVERKVLALRVARSTIRPVGHTPSGEPLYLAAEVVGVQRAYSLPVSARRFLRT